MLLNERLDVCAYFEAMNIKNRKEVKSMLVETIHNWAKDLRNEGIEKGIEEGKEKGKTEDALKMIEMGMNNSDIRKITDLSLKKINELRKKSNKNK